MNLCHRFPTSSSALLTAFVAIIAFSPVANSIDPYYTLCSNEANYTSNSTYQTNLNLLLSSLSSTTAGTGFFNDTKGENPNQAYGLALCRGDGSSDTCQTCLNASVQSIVQTCPQQKTAIIWYDDCLLRYSDRNFFSVSDSKFIVYLCNPYNVSERTTFTQLLGQLMSDLSMKAAYNSNRMFAVGARDFTSFAKVFGLAECTRDLSPSDCYGCLYDFTRRIPVLCDGKQGARIYGRSCLVRFELTSNTATPPLPPTTTIIITTPTPPDVSSPPNTTTASSARGKSESTVIVVVAVVIPVVAILVLLSATFLYLQRRRTTSTLTVRPVKNGGDAPELRSEDSLFFDLAVLRDATNDFSEENKLGEGGFGSVYKGVLSDGQKIAVKRLSTTSGQGLVELKNEVIFAANLQHRNLVRLLGCCLDEQEKLLVYEYLPNKSLDKILSDPRRRARLDWGKRYKIIEGIGRGLLYLHEYSRLRIIHRDLKASNILLDKDMKPKISDFGIAKPFSLDETQGNTSQIAGTYGYMPPEYALHGLFSTKSDVFSFGVLVLEIVTGRLNSSFQTSGNVYNLMSHVWKHWNAGMALQLRDQVLGDRITPEELLRCIQIGLLCVQEDAADRPSMVSVALMLSGCSIPLAAPSPPAFLFSSITSICSTVHRRNVGLASEQINERTSLSRVLSVNDDTLSDLDPR